MYLFICTHTIIYIHNAYTYIYTYAYTYIQIYLFIDLFI